MCCVGYLLLGGCFPEAMLEKLKVLLKNKIKKSAKLIVKDGCYEISKFIKIPLITYSLSDKGFRVSLGCEVNHKANKSYC